MNHRIKAIEKVKETIAKARAIYGRNFAEPIVRFDLRGRTAGTATAAQNLIRLNDVLLRENEEHFVSQTVPHEVAHLLTRSMFGYSVRSHGPEWKSVMRRLGLRPDRCHTYDTTNAVTRRSTRTISLFCGCMEHKVTPRVADKIARGVRYKCRKCKTYLASQAGAKVFGPRFTIE